MKQILKLWTLLVCLVAGSAMAQPSPTSPLSVLDYGATCNGSGDDTAAINSALAAASTGNTVILPSGGSVCVVSSTIKIPSGVTLSGGGMGGALPLYTGPVPTTLSWAGPGSTPIVLCPTGNFDCGLRNLLINGNQPLPETASGPICVSIEAAMGGNFEHIACENAGIAFLFQNTGDGNPGQDFFNHGRFDHLRALNVYDAFYFDGGSAEGNGSVSDTDMYNLFAWNFYGAGIMWVQSMDDIKLHGVYLSTSQNGAVGVFINPNNVSEAAPAANLIDSLTMDVSQPATTIVCNQTGGIYNVIKMQLIGGLVNEPVIRSGCLLALSVENIGALPMTQQIYDIWASPTITGNAATGYNPIDPSAFALFKPVAYSNMFQYGAGPIVSVEWVTQWVPNSAAGSIELMDGSNSAAIATATPGTAGPTETTVDITAYVKAHWAAGEQKAILLTAGNGTTGPTILKSFLRVTTTAY